MVFLFLLSFCLINVMVQQVAVTTRGDTIDIGGSVVYTVGQVAYTTVAGVKGSVVQGVQKSYEVSIVLGDDHNEINLGLLAYPNPTTDYLTLKVESLVASILHFQMYNIIGELIGNGKINSTSQMISMDSLSRFFFEHYDEE